MSFRFLSFSLVILAACSEDDTAVPWLEGSGLSDTTDGSGGLACGGRAAPITPNACAATERAAGAADESALGFAADTFLQLISGEHRAQVAWQLEGEPTSRSSELVLTVQPQGDVRFVEQTLRSSGLGETFTFGNTGAVYYTCGNHLAVDAELRVVMPDGTLDETIVATIEAESGLHARALLNVPSSSLVGSLRTAVEQGGADQLTLTLGISELGTGLEGSLVASYSEPSANVERGRPCTTLGSFSLAQGCPLGAYPLSGADDVQGLSFASALERLNATSPTTLADTGAMLSLTFTAEAEGRCVSVDTPATLPSVLEFPGSVSLESSDGRVGGTMEVQLRAEARNGELRVASAHTEYLAPDATGLAEMAESYAIREPLSWSRLEMGGFEFDVEAHEQQFGGVLRAIGGNLSCQGSRPCEEVCPGPGCTVSPAEKWAVRWGDMRLGTGPTLRDR